VSTASVGNFLTPKQGLLNQTALIPNQTANTLSFGSVSWPSGINGKLVLHDGQLFLMPNDKVINSNILQGATNSMPRLAGSMVNNPALGLPTNQLAGNAVQSNTLMINAQNAVGGQAQQPSGFLLANGQYVPIVTQGSVLQTLNNNLYLNGQNSQAMKLPGNGLLTPSSVSGGLLATTSTTTTLFPSAVSGAGISQLRAPMQQIQSLVGSSQAQTTVTTPQLSGMVKQQQLGPMSSAELPSKLTAMVGLDGSIILGPAIGNLPAGSSVPPGTVVQQAVIVQGGKKMPTRLMPKPLTAGATMVQAPAGKYSFSCGISCASMISSFTYLQ
jgi:hypothetical protein